MRVPPRLVLASIVGLWATYFLLATLRGVMLDYEFNQAFFSRRLLVTLASIVSGWLSGLPGVRVDQVDGAAVPTLH